MNTATKKNVPALATSVKAVVEAVKAFQESSGAAVNAVAVTAIINEHLHDETLFTKAHRPSALKAINKDLGTKLSLTQIKRIVTSESPKPTIHVDGLSGTAELPLGNREPTLEHATETVTPAELKQPAAAPAAAASTETAFFLVGGIEQAATKNQTNITESSQEHAMQTLVSVQRTAKESAAAGTPGEALVNPAAPANAAPAADTPAPAADAANDAPGKLNKEQYESVLEQLGITNAKEVLEFRNAFFANHFAMYQGFKAVEEAHPEKDQKAKFGIWVGQSDENTFAFLAFSKAYVTTRSPAAVPTTLTEKVMTTFRGNRASGFSSGVVAVAAAVVGGAGEMLMRGNVSIGSSVGAALGATAGYFAAEAAESLMESETGRYIVAGSIGLVAGGLGARIGRTVQDGVLNNAHADDVAQALPELKRPEAMPAPVSGAASIMALF